jgi:hypothetical protein
MRAYILPTVLASTLVFGSAESALLAGPAEGVALDRAVTLPAGTVLRLAVSQRFGSDISNVEDPVNATLVRPIVVDGLEVLPSGSRVHGYVSHAVRSGRVKGRGSVGVRFTRITVPGDESYRVRTRAWTAVAPATKKQDALKIGLPAAGGAAIGALIGGKKGAGIGALAGGGAGTAVVLSTRGRDVRVGRGAVIAVRLAEPLRVVYPR